jgi:hypothetical protein
MNLNPFKKPAAPQTEPEPTPEPEVSALVAAERELEIAAEACNDSSRHCAQLDELQREWMAQREAAFREHSKNLAAHSAAKDRWAILANPAPVVAHAMDQAEKNA